MFKSHIRSFTTPSNYAQLVRYFNAKEYNWSGLSEQQDLGGKLKRAAMQFTPYSFDDFDWRAFSTPVRCLESLGLVAIFLLLEVGAPDHKPSASDRRAVL